MTESNQQGEMPEDIIQRIGHLTRMLRNGMKELGLDKEIEKAADAIPDARDRLHYVGTMTEQAAERALNAIDIANPIQDSLSAGAKSIQGKWDSWLADPDALSDTDIHILMKETRDYLASVPESTASTQKQLLEIMMAQDFQDLTGQVIKKMMDVITGIEEQLVQVLIDNASPEQRDALKSKHKIDEDNAPSLLNGPQIKDDAEGTVSSQDQVDDLLSDLGF